MSTFCWADLHLGHKKIIEYSDGHRPVSQENHDQWIVSQWNSVVNEQDTVYILGDVSFSNQGWKLLDEMNGRKRLVAGNHDTGRIPLLKKYFERIYGIHKYQGMWLSHAPIHPWALRGKVNVHGHCHQFTINDPRYLCISVEQFSKPVSLETLRTLLFEGTNANQNDSNRRKTPEPGSDETGPLA